MIQDSIIQDYGYHSRRSKCLSDLKPWLKLYFSYVFCTLDISILLGNARLELSLVAKASETF